jgi:hypothetical protein
MGDAWRAKLDPRARAAVDEGAPARRMEVLVALDEPLTTAVRHQLEGCGLTGVSGDGAVVSGRVSDWAALERLAAIDAVQRVELSRPLFGESAEDGSE